MILPRLLQLTTILLVLMCLDLPWCWSALAYTSSQHIKTHNGNCLSFGTKVARLRECNPTDQNQDIHMLKINQTFQLLLDAAAKKVMCYDNKYRKLKIFSIKRLLKRNGRKPDPNLRRHKSSFGLEEANILLEATRIQGRYECGVHEYSSGSGYQYFNFGDSDAENMVWRNNGMIAKAKDIFCGYPVSFDGTSRKRSYRASYESNGGRRRSKRIKSSELSVGRSVDGSVERSLERSAERSHELSVERSLERSIERSNEVVDRKSQPQVIHRSRESRNNLVNRSEEFKNLKRAHRHARRNRRRNRGRSGIRRERIDRNKRRNNKGRCRKERDKFREFIYEHISILRRSSPYPSNRRRPDP